MSNRHLFRHHEEAPPSVLNRCCALCLLSRVSTVRITSSFSHFVAGISFPDNRFLLPSPTGQYMMRFSFLLALILASLSPYAVEADDGVNATETEVPTTSPGGPAPTPTFENEWSGCHPPGNPGHKIEIGKKTIVCLQIGNNENWAGGVQYIRASFQPEADEYSRMHIPNSFSDLIVQSNEDSTIFTEKNITLGAAVQDKLSFLRIYYDYSNDRVYPYLTAIVDVSDGYVRGITWDDSCLFCGGGKCDEITYNYNGIAQSKGSSGQPTRGCHIPGDICGLYDAEGNTVCDITIYVVWTGTDSKGKAFQSSAFRFSQFPAQEIENRLSQKLDSFTGDERREMQAMEVPMDL